jgi:adenylate cyclase, class 2
MVKKQQSLLINIYLNKMVDEIELKFLEINEMFLINKIESIGAVKKYDKIFRATAFDGINFSNKDSKMNYLRIRDEGDKVFLTYKSPSKDDKLHIRDEIEVQVQDFKKTLQIIKKLGFQEGPIINKHRIHYEIDNFDNKGKISFEIDKYPKIPTYLEIEVSQIKQMNKICELLELDINKGKKEMITELYPDLLKD